MSERVLAIDIGGTKIAGAVVDDAGRLLAEATEPTRAHDDAGEPRSGDEIYGSIATVLDALAPELPDPLRVGIGSAGPIEVRDGTISPVNVPGWRRYPVVERIRATLTDLGHQPADMIMLGDGHCVALGEYWLGAGRGREAIIGCICSTGVGAGVVLDGRAYQGRSGNAVHMGHTTVDVDGVPCVCGANGCVEAIASGTSMVKAARARGWQGRDMVELAQAARDGDPLALDVIDIGMRALGAGLAQLATTFDVPTVVVGGGVAKAGDIVFGPLERHFRHYVRLAYVADEAELLRATLPNAGLLGAAQAALAL